MKTFFSILFALSFQAGAAEIVTLTAAKQSVAVDPADVVQVVSVVNDWASDYAGTYIRFVKPGDEPTPTVYFHSDPRTTSPGIIGLVMTGMSSVIIGNGAGDIESPPPLASDSRVAITLRITRKSEQFFSEPVVMPALAGQDYKVELQTSTDLTNWIPAVPGDYLGGATNRFFRVKVEAKAE